MNWVRIGYSDAEYTEISRLLYYTDRVVTPGSTGEVTPIETVNGIKPSGVSGSFKHYLIEVAIDSDNYEAFYTQDVVPGGTTGYALRDSADNDPIGYVAAQVIEDNGTVLTITFETSKCSVMGKRSRYSNRDNVEFQPSVYVISCWGSRGES